MAERYVQLWKGVATPTDEAQAVRALTDLVSDSAGRAFALNLESEDAVLCIEALDYGIAERNLDPTTRTNFFLMLRRLAERHGRLPDRMMITETMEVSEKIVASGGCGDIRTGTYMGGLVAVKTARVAARDNFKKIKKQFYREVLLWETLSHPNILKLAGVDVKERLLITVSEWMAHGNIMEYIANNETNRLELLHGAAHGLEYLHSLQLAHGDLKGANILMSNDTPPRACLADFGFLTTVLGPGQQNSCSAQPEGCTVMFLAPEVLIPPTPAEEALVRTPQADIYAFGLVIYQVLTGENPFRGISPSALVFHVAVKKNRPSKPSDASTIGFSDSSWDFTQRCWDDRAELRPEAGEVVEHLGEATANWDGLMPPHVRCEPAAFDSGTADSIKYNVLLQPPHPPQTKRKRKMPKFLELLRFRR